jgi:hypothetical protein
VSRRNGELLCSGPRGRRLCWAALDYLYVGNGVSPFSAWNVFHYPEELPTVLESSFSIDLGQLAEPESEMLLLECMSKSVNAARYWQEPDELDVALANPRFAAALGRVAEAISASPASTWWSSALDLENQIYLDWADGDVTVPTFQNAYILLQSWRAEVSAPRSGGGWWSIPLWLHLQGDKEYEALRPTVAATTHSLPHAGSVGLLLEEDGGGLSEAVCWSVRPRQLARSFEIDGAADWLELVEHYGIDVTGARAVSWSQATGFEGRWVLPDWSVIANDYDVVHLTVNGYLTTSGRLLPVDPACATLLAGWSPDTSYWLTDTLEAREPAVIWEPVDHGRSWRVVR